MAGAARAAWGFAIDTSCHFLRILFSGAFDAYPKLQFILGHLGEGLPFAMHRLNDHTYRAAARRGLKKTPLEYLRDNMLVTTSGNWYEPAFVCTLLALGVDKILFAIYQPCAILEVLFDESDTAFARSSGPTI